MNVQVNAAINILNRLGRDLRGLKEEEETREPHSPSDWRGGRKKDEVMEFFSKVYIGHY